MTEEKKSPDRPRFGIWSIILTFVPILVIILMNTVIYPLFGKLPNTVERISFIALAFLPVFTGFIFAIVGLVKKEPRKWIHGIGLVLNFIQTIYWGFIAAFAG